MQEKDREKILLDGKKVIIAQLANADKAISKKEKEHLRSAGVDKEELNKIINNSKIIEEFTANLKKISLNAEDKEELCKIANEIIDDSPEAKPVWEHWARVLNISIDSILPKKDVSQDLFTEQLTTTVECEQKKPEFDFLLTYEIAHKDFLSNWEKYCLQQKKIMTNKEKQYKLFEEKKEKGFLHIDNMHKEQEQKIEARAKVEQKEIIDEITSDYLKLKNISLRLHNFFNKTHPTIENICSKENISNTSTITEETNNLYDQLCQYNKVLSSKSVILNDIQKNLSLKKHKLQEDCADKKNQLLADLKQEKRNFDNERKKEEEGLKNIYHDCSSSYHAKCNAIINNIPDDTKKRFHDLILEAIDILEDDIKRFSSLDFKDKKIFIVGDLHGDWDAYSSAIKNSNFVRDSSVVMVFLGDYGDRGPSSWRILADLISRKVHSPERIYMIRGNHEDLRITDNGFVRSATTQLEYQCGVNFLFKRLYKDSEHSVHYFIKLFDSLPAYLIMNNKILLTHGFIPPSVNNSEKGIPTNEQIKKFAISKFEDLTRPALQHQMRWQRFSGAAQLAFVWPHNYNESDIIDWEEFQDKTGIKYIVRGHDPVEEGFKEYPCGVLTLNSSTHVYFGDIPCKAVMVQYEGPGKYKYINL